MDSNNPIILSQRKIRQKLERMAYEIYERNFNEPVIVLAGINQKGLFVAQQLANRLRKISPITVEVVPVKLDPRTPNREPMEVDLDNSINDRVVIIVDDVANTGRTLLYAMKPFLQYLPSRIEAAVLVDREHKRFPVHCTYVGMSLSTTLHEHIQVEIEKGELKAVYLV